MEPFPTPINRYCSWYFFLSLLNVFLFSFPECSKNYSLVPYDVIVLTSPNYPNTYPLYDICLYGITSASANMYTYMSFNQLQLASDHCINIRQKFKNGTENAFSLNGNNMPDDIIFQGQTVIEFNSKKCNSTKARKDVNALTSDQGFVMNVMSSGEIMILMCMHAVM